jgi:hypothetical protein
MRNKYSKFSLKHKLPMGPNLTYTVYLNVYPRCANVNETSTPCKIIVGRVLFEICIGCYRTQCRLLSLLCL